MSVTTRSLGGDFEREGPLRLLVVEGSRARFVALAPRLVVGRGDDCDVVLDDETASRHHAMVLGTRPPVLEDIGSRHGTRVAGVVLKRGERRALSVGEVFVLGKTLISLQHAPAPTSTTVRVGMLAADPRMYALLEQVRTFGASRLPILVEGETGTGKELIAEAIHEASARAKRPLVRLNCAAFPENLFEAELFGFERGAFTGATSAKPGLLETADGGTLFLDEVAEMAPSAQAKLLRVLESGEVVRIGALKPRVIDVRIVAASHKNLEELVARGTFRQDLYYRICGAKLLVPALRDRPKDIVALTAHFLESNAAAAGAGPTRVSPAAMRALQAHPWPGNVRELRLMLLRAALLASNANAIEPEHLLLDAAPVAIDRTEDDDERALILSALSQCGHSQTRAAELLGIHRRTLMRRMDALGIARPRKGDSP